MQLFRRDKPSDKAGDGHSKGLKFISVQNESNVVLALMGLGGALFFIVIILLITIANNYTLAHRGKVYVQMRDGTTDLAQEFDALHRDPQILQTTAVTWMQMSFEWDSRIPNSDQVDAGVRVGKVNNDRVPTKVYLASYLMQDGFRSKFLQQMAQSVIPRQVLNGQLRSVLRFYQVSTPRQIAEGRWEVDIVATRIESDASKELREVPINRTITLQATAPVSPALDEKDPLLFRQKIYQLTSNGLVITDIVPLEKK
jgi:hypothetical protein